MFESSDCCFEDIRKILEKFKSVIIKPVGGNQGKGICLISVNNEKYVVNYRKTYREITEETEFLNFLKCFINKKYIIQKYIESVTKEGLPFDIRIHVRRGRDGNWKTVKIYPRIGTNDGITSNLSQGGYIAKLDPFLKRQFGDELASKIKKELIKLGKEFPVYFQKGYTEIIDALGLDIGLDKNGKLFLFKLTLIQDQLFLNLRHKYMLWGLQNM